MSYQDELLDKLAEMTLLLRLVLDECVEPNRDGGVYYAEVSVEWRRRAKEVTDGKVQ